MSFSNYHADSFIDLLNKRVDELNYKIVLAMEQLEVIKKFLREDGIALPERGGSNSSSSGVDYSVEILAIYQIIDVLPVLPNLPQQSLTWPKVINAIRKVPVSFLNNSLGKMYDDVYVLKGLYGSGCGSGSGSNSSITWTHLIEAPEKIPGFFNTSTLHTMFDDIAAMIDDVNLLKNNQGGTGSSGVDYSAEIQALQTITAKIPAFFNTTTLQEMWNAMNIWGPKINNLPKLPNPPNETLTWEDVINAVKMIPELQQTVTNIISQLNSQSLINLQTLQAALDEADGSLETISVKLQQMQ
jgi:hypothetical protein